jgi:hypothetical protein
MRKRMNMVRCAGHTKLLQDGMKGRKIWEPRSCPFPHYPYQSKTDLPWCDTYDYKQAELKEKVLSLPVFYTFASYEVTVHPALGINYTPSQASISDDAANRNWNFLSRLWFAHSHESSV